MRDELEQLLRSADLLTPERAQLRWEEYRSGADSSNPIRKKAADTAFATLLACYGGAIYRHIWGFIRSGDTEDVFQDVLAKLHQHRTKLPTFPHALNWLRTVAVRQCVDTHRRELRRKHREAETARSEEDTSDGSQRNQRELEQAIVLALAKLSPEQQQAIALHYFEGLNKQDAAAALGINRDTFADRLTKALTRLQRLLPVPAAVLLAGGAVGLPAALAVHTPIPSAHRLGELTNRALAGTTATGSRLLKPTALLAGLLAASGATWAAWPTCETAPVAAVCSPQQNPPTPRTEPVVPLETVPDRNLRVFRTEVLPQQLTALRGLLIGNGTVALSSLHAHDTRLQCAYELRHAFPERPASVGRIEFVRDTALGTTRVYFDMLGNGLMKPIDPQRPVILGRNPITGAELVMKVPALDLAVAAFDRLPHDTRTDTEAQAYLSELEREFAPYMGRWYVRGDPAKSFDLSWAPDGKLAFIGVTLPASVSSREHRASLWIDPTGRAHGLPYSYGPATLSADGTRVKFGGSADWWSREITPKP